MPFLSGWTKRKAIVYGTSLPGSNLTDFPLLLKIASDSDIATELSSGGGIAVTAADETTIIPMGVYPSSSLSSGDIILRTLLSLNASVTPGDVLGYLYYNAGKTTTNDYAGVVANNYILFMPLDEDPAGSAPQMFDWVSETNIGTTTGLVGQSSAAVGNGISIPDTSSYIVQGFTVTPSLATIEAIVNIDKFNAGFGLISELRTDGGSGFSLTAGVGWTFGVNNMKVEFAVGVFEPSGGTAITRTLQGATNYYIDNTRHSVAGRYDGTNLEVFLDAVSDGTLAAEGLDFSNIFGTVDTMWIGRERFDGTQVIDELRVSSVSRSNDWIAYGKLNDLDNSSTVELGDEETDSGGGGEIVGDASVTFDSLTVTSIGKVDIQGAANITFGVMSSSGSGVVSLVAAGSVTFATMTGVSTGAFGEVVTANAAITFGDMVGSGSSVLAVTAVASITFDSVNVSSTGTLSLAGSGSVVLGTMQGTSTGLLLIHGQGSITFSPMLNFSTATFGDNHGPGYVVCYSVTDNSITQYGVNDWTITNLSFNLDC